MSLNALVEKLEGLTQSIKADAIKQEHKGNKAAGRRVRKVASEIRDAAKEIRKASLDMG